MKKSARYPRPLLAVLAITVAAPAFAQDMGWSTITPSITGTDTLGLALRERMGDRREPATPRQGQAPAPQAHRDAAAPVASLDYRPSLERRRANIAAFLAKARQRSPKAADEIAAAFGTDDVIAKLGKLLVPLGLKTSNVADAFAVYWIVGWQATKGNNDDFSRPTAAAVRAQVEQALIHSNVIPSASDAAKQEFAETLLIQAILTDSAVSGARGDPKMLAIVARAARLNASAMGLDLDATRLTPRGFVPAG